MAVMVECRLNVSIGEMSQRLATLHYTMLTLHSAAHILDHRLQLLARVARGQLELKHKIHVDDMQWCMSIGGVS